MALGPDNLCGSYVKPRDPKWFSGTHTSATLDPVHLDPRLTLIPILRLRRAGKGLLQMVGNARVQASPEMCCSFEKLSNAHGVRSQVYDLVVVNL